MGTVSLQAMSKPAATQFPKRYYRNRASIRMLTTSTATTCTIPIGISGPRTGGSLARRRYQRGALRSEGNYWVLRWREDVLNETGQVVRVERRARIGATSDLPTKALARRVADRMLEHVNAPDYMPGKVARCCSSHRFTAKTSVRRSNHLPANLHGHFAESTSNRC